jgi:hypothetical protein
MRIRPLSSLTNDLQRRTEQPIEIRGKRFVFGDGPLDGFLAAGRQ